MTGHDALEWAVTMPWNGRSRCPGMGGHDRAEHAQLRGSTILCSKKAAMLIAQKRGHRLKRRKPTA